MKLMKILAISLNTFRETIRQKILYTLLICSIIFIFAAYFIGDLTLTDQLKIVKDMGLASISIFGTLMAIFIGISLVWSEIDRKTAYTIISKPIERWHFLLGKYLGLLLAIAVNIGIMFLTFTAVVLLMEHTFHVMLLKALFLIFIELAIITSIALLFSTFTTPTLSAAFTVGFFIIGHFLPTLQYLADNSRSQVTRVFLNVLYCFLPNLENFNIKGEATYNLPISNLYLLYATIYGLCYMAIPFVLAAAIFSRRDLK